MKKKLLIHCNRLLMALLAVLGFTGCGGNRPVLYGPSPDFDYMPLYGCPPVEDSLPVPEPQQAPITPFVGTSSEAHPSVATLDEQPDTTLPQSNNNKKE